MNDWQIVPNRTYGGHPQFYRHTSSPYGYWPSTGIDLLVRTQSLNKRSASRLLLYSTYYCALTISTSTINSTNQPWNTNPRINLRERGLIKFINKKIKRNVLEGDNWESVICYLWESKRMSILASLTTQFVDRRNVHSFKQTKFENNFSIVIDI